MKTPKPILPPALKAFVDAGKTTFHCPDGDWDLRIVSRDKSPFASELPKGAIMIAENGSGDCLFLKAGAGGKLESKVFVYWHEEERCAVFAKHLEKCIEARALPEPKAESKVAGPKVSLKELKTALASQDYRIRSEIFERFENSTFGLEALPILQKALSSDNMMSVFFAAGCIKKLIPELLASPDSDEQVGKLQYALCAAGNKTWSSGCRNCYSACLELLVMLKYEFIEEFVCNNIGLGEAITDSLEALKACGTPEALSLMKRGAEFWLPELNMREAKEVKAILDSAKPKKPAPKTKK